jgi:hypothetical protein
VIVLVCGTGRSGTTLVTELLARHGRTAFVSGVDDKLARLGSLGRWNGPLYRRAAGPRPSGLRAWGEAGALLERGRVRVAPSEGYRLIDRQVLPGFSRPCRDLLAEDMTPWAARRLRDFVDARLRAQRADVLVLHVTGWPRAGFLRAALPELRVVNVVRDGRAVASSWLQMGWWDGWQGPEKWLFGPLPPPLHELWEGSGRSFPVLAGLGWRMLVEASEAARGRAPDGTWLDLRYEDLLADPRAHAGALLEHAGLAWDDRFEAGWSRHRLSSERTEAFRRELHPEQVAAIEAAVGPTLRRWGYPVG